MLPKWLQQRWACLELWRACREPSLGPPPGAFLDREQEAGLEVEQPGLVPGPNGTSTLAGGGLAGSAAVLVSTMRFLKEFI